MRPPSGGGGEATLGGGGALPQLCFVGQEFIDALGASAYQVSGHKTVSLQGVTSELPVSVAQTRQQKLSSEPGGTSWSLSPYFVM